MQSKNGGDPSHKPTNVINQTSRTSPDYTVQNLSNSCFSVLKLQHSGDFSFGGELPTTTQPGTSGESAHVETQMISESSPEDRHSDIQPQMPRQARIHIFPFRKGAHRGVFRRWARGVRRHEDPSTAAPQHRNTEVQEAPASRLRDLQAPITTRQRASNPGSHFLARTGDLPPSGDLIRAGGWKEGRREGRRERRKEGKKDLIWKRDVV